MSLIFDTETNGLPVCPKYGQFCDYWLLNAYDNARIVQISYILTDDNYEIVEEKNTIIQRDNFPINNHDIHGITEEISDTQGILFIEWAKMFYNSLKKCRCIIAHNINFDINVLRSEMYRYKLEYIIELIDTKMFFCTMRKTKHLVGATFKNSNNLKDPNLKELYYYTFGEEMENHHNSLYDTRNLYEIVKKLKL